MIFTSKTSSIFARCRTQLRCLSSLSALTRKATCSDSYLTLLAKNSNKTVDAKVPFPESPLRYDRFLLEFVSTAEAVQSNDDFQMSTSPQMINHQFPEDPSDLEATLIQIMSRNTRRPKKANKGSRPCSRAGRRKRQEKIGNRSR